MYDLHTIHAMNARAARASRRDGTLPLVLSSAQIADAHAGRPSFQIPSIGSRRPRGWKLVAHYFVDTSGFGERGEPALTMADFLAKLRPGYGYAVIETGQFQRYVGEFSPPFPA